MASGLDNKISNIIGTKLPQWIIKQTDLRSNSNSYNDRSINNNLLYIANKTAWVRLVSSVDIDEKRDREYFATISNTVITDAQSLAKNFVLFGGTSKYAEKNSYQLRSGVSYSDANKTSGGAYGMLGKEEIQNYGYRPMPGITNVSIDTQGRLGSIRSAIINFKCWDKQQLDIIDALYFKLGFTMFLEWGHTFYYESKNPQVLKSTEDSIIIDPFRSPSLTKEEIYSQIGQTVRDTEGNYDAMLGMVTNFNFSYNQEGGYDCTLRLMSLGMLGDSIKINNPSTLPKLLAEQIVFLDSTLKFINEQENVNYITEPENPEDDPRNQTILRILNRKINSVDKEPENAQKSVIIDRAGILNSENKEIRYTSANLPNTQIIDPSSIKNYDFINPVEDSYRFYSQKFGIQIDSEAESSFVNSISLDLSKLREKININFGNYLQNRNPNDPFVKSIDNYLYVIQNRDGGLKNRKEYNSNYIFYKSESNKIYYFRIKILDAQILSKELQDLNVTSALPGTPGAVPAFFLNTVSRLFPSLVADPLQSQINFIDSVVKKDIHLKILQKLTGTSTPSNTIPDINLTFSGTDFDLKIIESPDNIFTSSDLITQRIDPSIRKSISSTNQGKSYVLKFSGQYAYPFTEEDKKVYNNDGSQTIFKSSTVNIPFIIETNDFSLVSNITPVNNPNILLGDYLQKQNEQALNEQNTQQAIKKEQERLDQEALLDQVQQSLSFQSALELILRTIQVNSLNRAIYQIPDKPDKNIGDKVFVFEFKKDKDFLNTILSNGLYTPIIDDVIYTQSTTATDDQLKGATPDDRLKIYAKYGFLSSLLANKTSLQEINTLQGIVDYDKLLTSFVIPYRIQQELVAGIKTNHPVYIPFGLLLMLINHSCTIYDNKGGRLQTPLVYIDYNPELNFFLTNNQQLTIDPFKVLIPFEGNNKDYQELFYDEVLTKNKTGIAAYKDKSQSIALFKPESEDAISYKIQEYAPIKFGKQIDGTSSFRGKVMNILLSIDYLTDLVRQYSLKDGTNNVYLRAFLEDILITINKCLGNFNSFRLAYNDNSNTFQIIDDQVIPTPGQEEMIDPKSSGTTPENRTEIPLIGKTSIAKNLQTKTEIGSKLGSLIAISANPKMRDKSTLSINAEALGFLNTAFSDRYVTNRLAIESNNTSSLTDSRIAEAIMFNSTITDFYASANPSDSDVSQVTSYYIEKMSKVKNSQSGSIASALVPVGIEFTTDGISGMSMGQAFTVSDQLLPYSYTAQYRPGYIDNYNRYVGFVITGLNHVIESNQWNTTVRTNMIAVKDKTMFKSEQIKELPKNDITVRVSNDNVTGLTNFVASNNKQSIQARAVVDKYLGRPVTDTEWNALVSIINAESSDDDEERANVLAVILNRAKNNSSGIIGVLKAPNQFEPVTGGNPDKYLNGPRSPQSENRIYNAINTYLPKITAKYLNFTSANRSLFYDKNNNPIPGRNQSFYDNAIKNKWEKIGGTLFGNA